MEQKQTIAIIGGTGKEGQGLAYRWLRAGHKVIIGSRSAEKAISAVESIKKMVNSSFRENVFGAVNSNAAEQADIVVLTIPYKFHEEMVLKLKPYLSGKVFMDVSVPLVPPKVSTVTIPKNGSAANNAKQILGEDVEVISAFQNISFELLLKDDPIECEVLVCGSTKDARKLGVKLVEDAGLKAWNAGPLENSIIAEGLTSILIRLNKQFGVHSAGIKITGIDR